MVQKVSPAYIRPLVALLGVIILICLLTGLFWPQWLVSVALGGLLAWIPQALFGWLVFRHCGASKIRVSVVMLLVAESIKLGLTLALFAVVFAAVQPSNPILLILTYVVVLLTGNWLNFQLTRHR